MNSIEKNLFKNSDDALTYLIPKDVPDIVGTFMKEGMSKFYSKDEIIEKANIRYIADNIDPYLELYLSMLILSEETARLVTFDSTNTVYYKTFKDFSKGKNVSDLSKLCNTYIWLYIEKIKNEKLYKCLFNYYKSSIRYLASDRSVYIQLLPTNTTLPLDQLARAMCAYL